MHLMDERSSNNYNIFLTNFRFNYLGPHLLTTIFFSIPDLQLKITVFICTSSLWLWLVA